MRYNILIVGAGQLGSRHLQSLSNLNSQYSVHVVDPSRESLLIAEERYNQVASMESPKVNYFQSMQEIKLDSVKVAIIATSAGVLLAAIKQMLNSFDVDKLVLEKVLFQSNQQLFEAQELLKEANVDTWVNCPRRMWPSYEILSEALKDCHIESIKITGTNWGLACNAIHFIDLWHLFVGFSEYKIIESNNIDVFDSKRGGYKELSGEIIASCSEKYSKLTMLCDSNDDSGITLDIQIVADGKTLQINEQKSELKIFDKNLNLEESKPFEIKFQSQLTSVVVNGLVESGDCTLTPLNQSAMLHEEFLDRTLAIFSEHAGSDLDLVPIT